MAEKEQKKEALEIPVRGGMLSPTNFPEALQLASLLAKSGMLPKQYEGNPGAVLVAMEMGAELGLPPMAAIQNIAVINGRPSLWGDAMLAVCTAHPDCEDVIEAFDEKGTTAICTVKRRGRSPIVRQFSTEDAKRAGMLGKQGPWQQYPQRMLQMRARGFALRDAFSDALRGIRSAEEERDIIDVTPREPDVIEPGIRKFGRRRHADIAHAAAPQSDTGNAEEEVTAEKMPAEKAPANRSKTAPEAGGDDVSSQKGLGW